MNAGNYGAVNFDVEQTGNTSILTALSLLCVIPPKTSFGSSVQSEEGFFAP